MSPISINVGGKIFHTDTETFRKFPGSVLSKACEEFELNQKIAGESAAKASTRASSDGPQLFFDRNPHLFEHVLDFCRNSGRFLRPNGGLFDDWERLEEEANFFELPQLLEQLRREQRDRPGLQEQLQLLHEALGEIRRPQQAGSFVELGETLQAVYLEGSDPQRQILLHGDCVNLRHLLHRFPAARRRLSERVDELGDRRGRRLEDEDIVSLVLPDSLLREAGLGGVDEFRLLLLREIAAVAADPAPPVQLRLPTGEFRLLFRLQPGGL